MTILFQAKQRTTMRNTSLCLFAILLFANLSMSAQTIPDRQADFATRTVGNTVQFEPILPALTQIAGAPQAYYEHYWEFGDGTFSFAEKPQHTYADTSDREVYYLATGKYDNGKAPKSRKKKASVPKEKPKAMADAGSAMPSILQNDLAPLGLRAVRNPRAGEELTCVLAYANRTPMVQSGTLHLFFNQKDYKAEHFGFIESRSHFGEKEIAKSMSWHAPLLHYNGWASLETTNDWYAASLPAREPEEALSELENRYRSNRSWNFEGLQSEELRHLFFSFQATDAMLADTNAIITITVLMISDDRRVVEQYDLEMEIVASHDPNYIAVSQRRTGFRGIRAKDLVYKVHFQNNGEGPASRVEVTCDVPPGLHAAGLQVIDLYPQCLLCPDQATSWSCLDTTFLEGKVVFTFQNIYLPGTRQEGLTDRDSTKGFIKYRLLPDKKIRKLSLDSRASIVFDKNPPIRTNGAATAFKPGFSPGLMAGWNIFPDDAALNHFTIGISAAPFSPYRRFFQYELWIGLPNGAREIESASFRDTVRREGQMLPNLPFSATVDSVTSGFRNATEEALYFSIVPLQLRKNMTDWLSFGGGLMLNLEFLRRNIRETGLIERRVYNDVNEEISDFYLSAEFENNATVKRTKLRAAVFADVHLGLVRKGPALALRPVLRFGEKPSFYVSAFAYWKF